MLVQEETLHIGVVENVSKEMTGLFGVLFAHLALERKMEWQWFGICSLSNFQLHTILVALNLRPPKKCGQ